MNERLWNVSNEIVKSFKAKNFQKVGKLVHPIKGVIFSPYVWLSEDDLVFSEEQVKKFKEINEVYTWGGYNGSGALIKLTPLEYYERWIYNEDYENAKQIALNKRLGEGAIEDIKKVFPNSIFVAYYFPGFDPQYSGMDWCSLTLVFEEYNGKLYLIAVIHGEWTI